MNLLSPEDEMVGDSFSFITIPLILNALHKLGTSITTQDTRNINSVKQRLIHQEWEELTDCLISSNVQLLKFPDSILHQIKSTTYQCLEEEVMKNLAYSFPNLAIRFNALARVYYRLFKTSIN